MSVRDRESTVRSFVAEKFLSKRAKTLEETVKEGGRERRRDMATGKNWSG